MPTVNGYINPELGSNVWPEINTTLQQIEDCLPTAGGTSSTMSFQGAPYAINLNATSVGIPAAANGVIALTADANVNLKTNGSLLTAYVKLSNVGSVALTAGSNGEITPVTSAVVIRGDRAVNLSTWNNRAFVNVAGDNNGTIGKVSIYSGNNGNNPVAANNSVVIMADANISLSANSDGAKLDLPSTGAVVLKGYAGVTVHTGPAPTPVANSVVIKGNNNASISAGYDDLAIASGVKVSTDGFNGSAIVFAGIGGVTPPTPIANGVVITGNAGGVNLTTGTGDGAWPCLTLNAGDAMNAQLKGNGVTLYGGSNTQPAAVANSVIIKGETSVNISSSLGIELNAASGNINFTAGLINIGSLPASSAGLTTGHLYTNAGAVMRKA
jgi:hypothetical protein